MHRLERPHRRIAGAMMKHEARVDEVVFVARAEREETVMRKGEPRATALGS